MHEPALCKFNSMKSSFYENTWNSHWFLYDNPLTECEQLLCISFFFSFLLILLCIDVYLNMA